MLAATGDAEQLSQEMKNSLKWVFFGFVILGVILIFEQSTYRGGKRRFEQYFGAILSADTELLPLSLWTGSYWDDPRFRFRLRPEEFDAFSKGLALMGYSKWTEMGGKYGSFNEESTSENPLLCSSKHAGRVRLRLYYRPSTGIVDAVTFYH